MVPFSLNYLIYVLPTEGLQILDVKKNLQLTVLRVPLVREAKGQPNKELLSVDRRVLCHYRGGGRDCVVNK